ncbi:hypothetical protein [Vibrio sp. SCSIO 43136]|uniref:terminase small subunit-like protein n=1 Tax=Vibrio sp. SCSIO 43136 TaxID=2819101 RepID=UPI002076580A|nr:hypothetical protein [Vibrio sp. SCSIO 43136]USD64220.1 hypothetical protein J4N39_08860 [Vibrio sp. SCSIO 43136]
MKKRGRPSSYTVWKGRAICIRLMMGESLRSICDRKYYPSKMSVLRWLQSNEEFRAQYTQAREVQQELLLDEMFEIADDASNDYMERTGKDGECVGYQINGEYVQRSRLRIDTRKWVMERMAPKKYGAKQQVEHSGSISSMPDEVLDDKIAKLIAKTA